MLDQHQLQLDTSNERNSHATHSSTSSTQRSLGSSLSEHARWMEKVSKRPELEEHGSHFFARTKVMARARKIYLKAFIGGAFMVILTIFAVFPIYWGSLWRIPTHPLNGWVVDFDGGEVGEFFGRNIMRFSDDTIVWSRYLEDRIRGLEDLVSNVLEERAWVAVVINAGVSNRLNEALRNPSTAYNSSLSVTIYGVEARNENAYRVLIYPTVTRMLDQISHEFAIQFAQRTSSSIPSSSLQSILSASPQLIISPVFYTAVNLRPFDEPVASAATFVGLIYLLILSFYVVMIGDGARRAAGMPKLLSYSGLVRLRLSSSILAYFFLSLFYSLVNLAFQIDFTRKFGKAGFVVFWMANWAGMMSVGLALESLVTILTTRFIPFFMIFWIISNVSVCIYPIQTLPRVFHYGYAAPFYNVSRAFRTIAFNTRNQLGLNFGILSAWIIVSCITLPVFQWVVWRRGTK